MLGINNCLQIIEIGVRRVVLCLSQDGACTESFENFRDNSLKGSLSNDIIVNPPLSHWKIPLNKTPGKKSLHISIKPGTLWVWTRSER
jgi:hypothetical protein